MLGGGTRQSSYGASGDSILVVVNIVFPHKSASILARNSSTRLNAHRQPTDASNEVRINAFGIANDLDLHFAVENFLPQNPQLLLC